MMNFEAQVAELVRRVHAVSPKDNELALVQLREVIAANDRTSLRLVSLPDREELSDNMPV